MPLKDSAYASIFGLAFWLGGGSIATASSFYTVTDLGPNWSQAPVVDAKGLAILQNYGTGATVPFGGTQATSTPIPIDIGKIQPEQGFIGATNPEPATFSVRVISSNILGNFIGGFPDGSSLAIPYSALSYSYFARQPDGSYQSEYIGPSYSFPGQLRLNAKDQILAWGGILNLDTNTQTNLDQIVSPEILAQLHYNISLVALADDGTILALAQPNYSMPPHYFLLTPPGLPAPIPTPEPTTLAVLAVGLGIVVGRLKHAKRVQNAS
jgi:hypothetical protein